MRFTVLFALLSASVLLAGCGAHSKDYLKKDKNISSLVVPSGVPVIKQESYYPVPNIPPQNINTKSPSLKPPTLSQ